MKDANVTQTFLLPGLMTKATLKFLPHAPVSPKSNFREDCEENLAQ